MNKIIQRPLVCRNAHCGAMCSPADAEFMGNPSKCYKYERRDDLYLPKSPIIPDNATNYDALKAIFGSITAFRIKDAMEFEEGFETWFFEPYKEIER